MWGEWIEILRRRLEMYRSLREDTVARLGQARYDEYNQLYAFFVGLVQAGKLGGARFSATAAPAAPLLARVVPGQSGGVRPGQ